ncbi:MAG: ferritin, partial [Kocuria sp.]|nr:ferritin [Kocuria sp.]
MKMSTDLEKKFQDQITLEFEASITYRQLAIEADEQDLPGIAAWL